MKRAVSTLVAVVAVVALSACGGDDGGADTGDAGSVAKTTDAPAESSESETTEATTGTTGDTAGTLPAGLPDGVQSFVGLSQDHTGDDVVYNQTPPVGGPHDPQWQECGVYDEPIREEKGVHSMEHGAVWITYQPGLGEDQVKLIAALADGRSHVLVTPFEGLPSPVVASAWGQQLAMESATDPRLAQFVDYFEQGPQTPEPGVPC